MFALNLIKLILKFLSFQGKIKFLKLFSNEQNRAFFFEKMQEVPGLASKMGQILAEKNQNHAKLRPSKISLLRATILHLQMPKDLRIILQHHSLVRTHYHQASIANVYHFIPLQHAHTQTHYALKVTHRAIAKKLLSEIEFFILSFDLFSTIKKITYNTDRLREYFIQAILNETNFHQEIQNHLNIYQATKELKLNHIIIPKIEQTYSNNQFILSHYIESQHLSQFEFIAFDKKRVIANNLCQFFFEMLLQKGILYLDLHDKNWALHPLHHKKDDVIIFDFGAVMYLSEPERGALINLIQMALSGDTSNHNLLELWKTLEIEYDQMSENEQNNLSILIQSLLLPITQEHFKFEQWNLNSLFDQILQDEKWSFRGKIHPKNILIVKAFFLLFKQLNKLSSPNQAYNYLSKHRYFRDVYKSNIHPSNKTTHSEESEHKRAEEYLQNLHHLECEIIITNQSKLMTHLKLRPYSLLYFDSFIPLEIKSQEGLLQKIDQIKKQIYEENHLNCGELISFRIEEKEFKVNINELK